MPTIVKVIDDIAKWAQEAICNKILLKAPYAKPPDKRQDIQSGMLENAAYNEHYALVHPTVYPLYYPVRGALPPGATDIHPSLCIQMLDGLCNGSSPLGTMQLRFLLGIWNPGKHAKDIFTPIAPNKYEQGADAEFFMRDAEGWRDAWNFADVAMDALLGAGSVGGYRLDMQKGIKYGVPKENNAIQDYYPYWYAMLDFTIEHGITYHRDVDEFL